MKYILLLIGFAGLVACANGKKVADSAHNSENSIDWAGRYNGTLSCADCEGISVNLILNADNSFSMSSLYVGKSDKLFHTNGTFTWSTKGDRIVLSTANEFVPINFKVTEGALVPLNEKGKTLKTEKGTLQKNEINITEKEWYLFEISGKNIKTARDSKEPFLYLGKEGNASGNGGCNTFSGSYTTSGLNGIRFGVIAATKMACPSSMQLESTFFEVLSNCDNYTLNGDTLSLNKAKMAPLARFVLR